MKFLLPVTLLLSNISPSSGEGHVLRGNLPSSAIVQENIDWKVDYEAYRKTVDPDDIGFVMKLYSKGTRHAERGDDYGFMCRGKECDEDDWLVTGHINNNQDKFRFEYIPHPTRENTGQIKTKTANLCFGQHDIKEYRLFKCDNKDKGQLFKGFDPTAEKFVLVPYEENDWCITMLHRPRSNGDDDGEIIKAQRCEKALKTQTGHWSAEFRPRVVEEIGDKDYKCSSKDQCDECQGGCSSDKHCKSGLKCYERNGNGWRHARDDKDLDKDPWAPIPGCKGYGSYGENYCYDPKKEAKDSWRPIEYSK